jgi:hypothetical protein
MRWHKKREEVRLVRDSYWGPSGRVLCQHHNEGCNMCSLTLNVQGARDCNCTHLFPQDTPNVWKQQPMGKSISQWGRRVDQISCAYGLPPDCTQWFIHAGGVNNHLFCWRDHVLQDI